MEPIRFDTNDAFVAYALPDQFDYKLIYENDSVAKKRVDDTPHFIISAFEQSDATTQRIYADNIDTNRAFSFKPARIGDRFVDTQDSYLKKAEYCIEATQSIVEKVVLSRIKVKEVVCTEAYDVFIRMVQKYPEAFTYIFNIPNVGCWVGASPEILLEWDADRGTTMALAGSRPASSDQKEHWSVKNMAEQAKVTAYLEQVLTAKEIVWQKSDVHIKRAGPVEHLSTTYSLSGLKDGQAMLNYLHPTPAVCGQPLETAKSIIDHVEEHDRRYYTGYLGPINMDGTNRCFVNLRCMELSKDRAYMYVGGGIMPDSQAKDEWTETEIKAMTLGSILDTVYFSDHAIK